MKKGIALFLAFFASLSLFAGDDKPISVDKLPVAAKEFITQHFSGTEISLATMDKELFDTTYEVFFTDGCKVEFGKNGQWTDIDCKYSRVPQSAIPAEIYSFVTTRHPERYIKEIDRDRYDYEIKLDNGLELKFDLNFRLTEYDN